VLTLKVPDSLPRAPVGRAAHSQPHIPRELRHVRIGTNIYVPAGAVEEFIHRNTVEPATRPPQESIQ
jgi:hypothetical protein